MKNTPFTPRQLAILVSRFLHRFHVLLFTCITVGGLSYATYALNAVISQSSVQTPPSTSTQFDAVTMDKVKTLRKASESSQQLTLPSGRTDPFN